MPVKPDHAPLAGDTANGGMALVVIDMISTWDFEGGSRLGRAALAIAPRIGALKHRCVLAGVPTIYVNDNRGRWRSEFRELVHASVAESATGAAIAASLLPQEEDYSVLKPKHSAFYATPLDLLLRELRVDTVVLCGVAGDQCVLSTAGAALLRGYRVIVPRDAIPCATAQRERAVVAHFHNAMDIRTPHAARLRWR